MDKEEHFAEKNQQKFFTRSTARHLRRKRLNDARRAEREQTCLINGVNGDSSQQIASERDTIDTEILTKSKARRLRKKNKAKLVQKPCYFCSNGYDSEYDFNSYSKLEPDIINNDKQVGYKPDKAVCHVKYDKKIEYLELKFQNIESEEDLSELSCSSGSSDLLKLGNEVQTHLTKHQRSTEHIVSVLRLKQKIEETIKARINCIKENSQLEKLETKSFSNLEKSLSDLQKLTESTDFGDLNRSIQICDAECDKKLETLIPEFSTIKSKEDLVFNFDKKFKKDSESVPLSGFKLKPDKIILPPSSQELFEIVKNLKSNSSQEFNIKTFFPNSIDLPRNLTEPESITIPSTVKIEDITSDLIEDQPNTTSNLNLSLTAVQDSTANLNSSAKSNTETTEVTNIESSSSQNCPTESNAPIPLTNVDPDKSTITSSLPAITPKNMTNNKLSISEKSREEIKAEREAKKAAKAAAKAKAKTPKSQDKQDSSNTSEVSNNVKDVTSNEEVRNANKEISEAANTTQINAATSTTVAKDATSDAKIEGKSKAEMRAERRAKQEAQRAAKQQLLSEKSKTVNNNINKETNNTPAIPVDAELGKKIVTPKKVVLKENVHEVNLFKHLYHERELAFVDVPPVNSHIHIAIVKLGMQYANKIIVGSNARCVALLSAIKQLVKDFERPSQADFIRGFEAKLQESVAYLHYCRPLAVSMQNALKHLKWQMTQLPATLSDVDAKIKLGNAIDTYILEQIQLADKAISITIQTKISNGNVILTYGYSSLIHKILLDAHNAGKKFRVIVVDGRPWLEGKEQLRRLAKDGIECSYILINALSFVMPEVSKVFLGAHAILANGAVMSRVGTAQVALMAKAFNVPVLVACETHKSCERVQTDSIVYNELGDADKLVQSHGPMGKKCSLVNWRTKKSLNLLNITYDVTPADLVTAVVTELAILPCTSVPVILRIKPSEI